jgi:hypothetical protein
VSSAAPKSILLSSSVSCTGIRDRAGGPSSSESEYSCKCLMCLSASVTNREENIYSKKITSSSSSSNFSCHSICDD